MNGTYESIYLAALGGWIGGGNYYFSVDAAPAAALLAEAAQEEKGRLGLVNGFVYGTFRKSGYKGKHPTFYDITGGRCLGKSGAPPCPPKGYDDATGIAAMDGQNLAKAL